MQNQEGDGNEVVRAAVKDDGHLQFIKADRRVFGCAPARFLAYEFGSPMWVLIHNHVNSAKYIKT